VKVRIANGVRKPRFSVYKSRVSYLVFGVLLISFASFPSFAKGPTRKITIENPRFPKPIEITDPATTTNFQVFAGPGTSTNEAQSLIIDWATGAVTPPSGLESYRVSFYLPGYVHPYVVLYAFDHSNKQGYVYLPGKKDEWYRTNISIVTRRVEGNWFRALVRWEDVARPMIEKQLTISLKK